MGRLILESMLAVNSAGRHCDQCGAPCGPAARFCSECGHRLPERKPAAVTTKSTGPFKPGTAAGTGSPAGSLVWSSELVAQTIDAARKLIKTHRVAIPRPSNPAVKSLMESLRLIPPQAGMARCALITALGETRDPAVLPALLSMTTAASREVRRATAAALRLIRHPLAAYLLLPLLRDGSSRVRQQALSSLLHHQPGVVGPPLLAASLTSRTLQQLLILNLNSMPPAARQIWKSTLMRIGSADRRLYEAAQSIEQASVATPRSRPAAGALQNHEAVSAASLPATDLASSFPPQAPLPSPAIPAFVASSAGQPHTAHQPSASRTPAGSPAKSASAASTCLPDSTSDLCHELLASAAGSENERGPDALAAPVPELTFADAGVENTHAELLTSQSNDPLELSGRLPVVGADPRWASLGSGPGDSADDVRLLEPVASLSDVSLADSGLFHAIVSSLDESEPLVVTSTSTSAASSSNVSALRNAGAGSDRSLRSSDTWSSPLPDRGVDRGGHPSRKSSLPVAADKGHAPPGPADDDGPPRSGASQRAFALLQSLGRPAPVHASSTGATSQSAGPAMDAEACSRQMPAFPGRAFDANPGPVVWPGGSDTTTTATMNGSATFPVLSTTQSGSAVIQVTSHHPETAGGRTSSTSPDGVPPEDALTGEAEARLERAWERFRRARDAAFKTLTERATVSPVAVPRGLARRIAQLQATPKDEVEKITGLIRETGEFRSSAALSALSTFSQKPQKEIRAAVAEVLGRIRDDGSAILLMRLSSDKADTVVESALRSLVALSIDATLPVIVMAALCQSGLRTLVASLVESAPDETKPAWEQCLLSEIEHGDPEVVAFAVSTLVRLTGAAHFDHYMRLADHESPVVRAAAVEALARTGVKRAISRMNKALQDGDARVRAQAALAMSAFHSPKSVELLSGLLSDPDVSVRRNAALSLSRMDEEGMSDVLAGALSRETDRCTVESLLAAVSRHGDAGALPVLTRYIESEDAEFREQALKALRRLKLPESTPLFLRLLADPAASIRRQSAEQLGVLQCKAALPQFRELLKRDSDETVRAACAKALAELQDPSALPLLEEALGDVSAVRLQAVISLGLLGQAAAGPLLIRLLHDARPEIRYQAVRSLAALKLEDSTAEIERLLEDPDELVRRGAQSALSELGVSRGRQQWKVFQRKSVRLLSSLAPGRLAAMIPGGPAVFLTACVLIAAVMPLGVWWSVSGKDPVAVLPVTSVTGVSISGDGSVCAAVRKRDVIDVWDVQTGELKDRFSGPPGVAAVVLNRTGDEVLLVTMSGIIRRKVGEESGSLPAPQAETGFQGNYLGLQRNADAGTVALFIKEGGQLRIIQLDMTTLSVKWDRRFHSGATSRGFVSRNEEFAAVPGVATQLEIFDVKTARRFMVDLSRLFGESNASGVAAIKDVCFSDDQKRLAVVRPGKPVSVIDVETMRPVAELLKGQPVSAAQVRFLPDSHDLIVICTGGEVCRITQEFTTESIRKVDGLPPFSFLSLSDDGRFLVSAQDEERTLVSADVEAGRVLHMMPGQG